MILHNHNVFAAFIFSDMEINTFNNLYLKNLVTFMRETPNKIYILSTSNCPNLNHQILKLAEALEKLKAVTISVTSTLEDSLEIQQHVTTLKTSFIILNNILCLEFSTNLLLPDKKNYYFPIIPMDTIYKQVKTKAIPALVKNVFLTDELSFTTLFIMQGKNKLKYYTGINGWPTFSVAPVIFEKESPPSSTGREVDQLLTKFTLEDDEDEFGDLDGFGLFDIVEKTGKSSKPTGTLPEFQIKPSHVPTPSESGWITDFHTFPSNKDEAKYFPIINFPDLWQAISLFLINDPKYVTIGTDAIKHAVTNKLAEVANKVDKKYTNNLDQLLQYAMFFTFPNDPRLTCYLCNKKFKTVPGTLSHKRSSANCNDNNQIKYFIRNYSLRYNNVTEDEKAFISDAVSKSNKFGSNVHYEESYREFIWSLLSQIKYTLTSITTCLRPSTDSHTLINLISVLINKQPTTVDGEELINKCLSYLESQEVRYKTNNIFLNKT